MKNGFIILLFGLISCNEIHTKKNFTRSINEIDRTEEELRIEIVDLGSIEAYQSFQIAFLDDKNFGDFYQMSKVMADRYNYAPAYYSVYSCLLEKVTHDFSNYPKLSSFYTLHNIYGCKPYNC